MGKVPIHKGAPLGGGMFELLYEGQGTVIAYQSTVDLANGALADSVLAPYKVLFVRYYGELINNYAQDVYYGLGDTASEYKPYDHNIPYKSRGTVDHTNILMRQIFTNSEGTRARWEILRDGFYATSVPSLFSVDGTRDVHGTLTVVVYGLKI